MSGKAILIAGYPGSGKTCYGNLLKREISAVAYVDDYHRYSIDHKPAFDHGRKYQEMIEGLKQGETWIASDREWCRPRRRRKVEFALRAAIPDIMIEWQFIEADEDICRERVRTRGRESVKEELRSINDLSREYHIPSGSKVIQVGTEAGA